MGMAKYGPLQSWITTAVTNRYALSCIRVLRNPDNRRLVQEAVHGDGKVLEFASNELKNDKEILLAACEQIGLIFTAEERLDIRSIVLAAVTQEWRILQLVSQEMKGDRELCTAAVAKMRSFYWSDELI